MVKRAVAYGLRQRRDQPLYVLGIDEVSRRNQLGWGPPPACQPPWTQRDTHPARAGGLPPVDPDAGQMSGHYQSPADAVAHQSSYVVNLKFRHQSVPAGGSVFWGDS